MAIPFFFFFNKQIISTNIYQVTEVSRTGLDLHNENGSKRKTMRKYISLFISVSSWIHTRKLALSHVCRMF